MYFCSFFFHHQIELYNEALESVNKVLQTDPENVKALYRCGKVYMIKGDFEQAVHYLQKASVLNPDERVSYQLLQYCSPIVICKVISS